MTAAASDAPQRAAGLRTRSGNAMLRTRTAILDAAAACVERQGVRRTTMGDIAATGGVAKATLYNHFRTKDDVLAALVEVRITALAAECEAIAAGRPDPHPVPGLVTPERGSGLAAALAHAAAALASSRPLRRVAAEEPALLVPLAVPGEGRGWQQARSGVGAVLGAAGAAVEPAAVEVVLRWLLSQLLWASAPDAAQASAELLARGVAPTTSAGASAVPEQGRPSERAQPAGVGWPGKPARLPTR